MTFAFESSVAISVNAAGQQDAFGTVDTLVTRVTSAEIRLGTPAMNRIARGLANRFGAEAFDVRPTRQANDLAVVVADVVLVVRMLPDIEIVQFLSKTTHQLTLMCSGMQATLCPKSIGVSFFLAAKTERPKVSRKRIATKSGLRHMLKRRNNYLRSKKCLEN